MSALVTMMLRAGVITPEQAKDARGHQIVFGDRIGTNLLALGFVSETTLAQALGALHGVPYAAGLAADSKPGLTRTLPRQVAARLSAVPVIVDAGAVTVFMLDPHDGAALTELAAHYRRPVQAVVVCEGRMWALLNKYYLVRRGMRALKLDGPELRRTALVSKAVERRASSGEGEPVAPSPAAAPQLVPTPVPPPAPTPRAPRPAEAPPTGGASLVDLLLPSPSAPVAQAPAFGFAAAAPPAIPVAAVAATDAAVDNDAPWLVPVAAPPENVDVRPPSRSFAEADVPFEDLEALLTDGPAAAHDTSTDLLLDAVEQEDDGDGQDDDDAARRAPLSFADARAELARVTDRNEIARVVLRAAAARARRAILLTVQGDAQAPVALGWDALGDALTPRVVHELRFSLVTPSVLQLAYSTRGHVLGPSPRAASTASSRRCSAVRRARRSSRRSSRRRAS